MNAHHISQFVAELWDDSIVPALHEYIRIPAKSPAFDAEWHQHGYLRQAVGFLQGWVAKCGVRGLQQRIVELPGRTPILIAEVAGTAPGTALLYGHYDKQPEFDGWAPGLSPWQPVLRDGRLYGRGGADDGYACFAALAAIAALQSQNLPHPRCVVLIEGCEESGSFDLPHYMDALAEDIGTPDLVVCLDAECGNYEQLWLTTSLRGALSGTLRAKVLAEGVHSGAAGGIVPCSFRLLRQLIERVETAATGRLIDLLQVEIPAAVYQQADAVAEVLGDVNVQRFPWAGDPPTPTPALVVANTWGPSLAVVGVDGAPAIADAGNTLRPATAAKLVFRLPPTLPAADTADRLRQLLQEDPPQGAEISFQCDGALDGWHAPPLAAWLETALAEASREYFGAALMSMGTGGTIPFMKMLGDRYPNVQFAVTGVLGPHSNAHGPNEFLHIATGKRITACTAHMLNALAVRAA